MIKRFVTQPSSENASRGPVSPQDPSSTSSSSTITSSRSSCRISSSSIHSGIRGSSYICFSFPVADVIGVHRSVACASHFLSLSVHRHCHRHDQRRRLDPHPHPSSLSSSSLLQVFFCWTATRFRAWMVVTRGGGGALALAVARWDAVQVPMRPRHVSPSGSQAWDGASLPVPYLWALALPCRRVWSQPLLLVLPADLDGERGAGSSCSACRRLKRRPEDTNAKEETGRLVDVAKGPRSPNFGDYGQNYLKFKEAKNK